MIVALYARVSTARQAEKDLSIPDQLRQTREWCKAKNHQIATEYIELGASATDDKRPVFQEMMTEACQKPPAFDAIIVHSLSRFFRDAIEFGLCERRLKKFGVSVVSITQETSDDPTGQMVRQIFKLFDEYQSKENGKHTLRAMKENARQGYFNGSTPPYGYRVKEVESQGNKGKKKVLDIDTAETAIVNSIYQLYLNGYNGRSLGVKSIAAYLNDRGITMRGRKWKLNLISKILSNRAYLGEYVFNKKDSRAQKIKPESEWITISVPPIIDIDSFNQTETKREHQRPSKMSAVNNSHTLLTGLLRCGCCGERMTIATGKGGRYRYYKCSSKIRNIGQNSCTSGNVPMEKLDEIILHTLAERVFTPERVNKIMKELQTRLKASKEDHHEELKQLARELEEIKKGTDKLYEAVEKGMISINDSLTERVQKHQARRQEILIEMARLRGQKEMKMSKLGKNHIVAFCKALKERFQDKASNFGKEYLKLLVDEIRIVKQKVHLTGSYAALAGALCSKSELDSLPGVPSAVMFWLPSADSNHGHGG